jgi:dynein heavy chain
MERINKDRNCKRALTENKEGRPDNKFLQELYDLNEQFEKIQRYLKQFLEAKRSQFPRFYFLSDEDLLEIIGQSKDPKPIVAHIGKMFEGVHNLNINEVGGRNQKGHEIDALLSNDGEKVDLVK